MKDLAPDIYRKRLVVEGIPTRVITDHTIKDYLLKVSDALNMKTLLEQVTHKSDKFGWAGWVDWQYSEALFYVLGTHEGYETGVIVVIKIFNRFVFHKYSQGFVSSISFA